MSGENDLDRSQNETINTLADEHSLIGNREWELLHEWGIAEEVITEIVAVVSRHEKDYTQATKVAENVARADKYLSPNNTVIIRAVKNAMGGYAGGECGVISSQVRFEMDYLGISEKLSERGISVRRARVEEPEIFNGGSTHIVLVMCKDIDSNLDPETLDQGKTIIVDAPLQKIRALPDSGYKVLKIFESEVTYPDTEIKITDWDPGHRPGTDGTNAFTLCLTADGEYSLSVAYLRYKGKIFPGVYLNGKNKVRGSVYYNPITGEVDSRLRNRDSQILNYFPNEALSVLDILQKPKFKVITKEDDISFTDIDGNKYSKWVDKNRSPLNMTFHKGVN